MCPCNGAIDLLTEDPTNSIGAVDMVLAQAFAGGDRLRMESLLRHAQEMETELLGSTPTPLERLAVQRIVACWLETNYVAIKSPEPTGETLKHARFALQVRESAEKRFNAAVKSYSLVRQLLGTGGKAADRRQPNTAAVPANGNGQGHKDTLHATAPVYGNGHACHVPANRIQRFVGAPLAGANGHKNRLNIFGLGADVFEPQPEPEEALI